MTTPKISRPKFPPGYADKPASYLTWDWVAAQLAESKHYWLCSVRPPSSGAQGGRPHVTLNLESGEQAIILEGTSADAGKPTPEFAQRLAKAISEKYAEKGYSPDPNQWDEGGLFIFTPKQCIVWSVFYENPTKFIFEAEEPK